MGEKLGRNGRISRVGRAIPVRAFGLLVDTANAGSLLMSVVAKLITGRLLSDIVFHTILPNVTLAAAPLLAALTLLLTLPLLLLLTSFLTSPNIAGTGGDAAQGCALRNDRGAVVVDVLVHAASAKIGRWRSVGENCSIRSLAPQYCR